MSISPSPHVPETPKAQVAHPFELPPQGVALEVVEKSLIVQALERTRSNQSAAARLLGISRYALRYRMAKHGLR
jgi:DNA-binding NtrC family response regulator